MKKRFERIIPVVLITAFSLMILGGCTNKVTEPVSKSSEAVSATSAPEAAVKLTVWNYPFNSEWEQVIKDSISDYTKNKPNVTFAQETIPYDGGPEKVNIAIAANSVPNILQDAPGRVLGYAAKGVIEPVDDVLDAIKKDYSGGLLNAYGHTDSKRYGIALWGNLICGIANKALFEAAGAANLLPQNPEGSWTTDEFVKAMEAIKNYKGKAADVYPLALYAGDRYGDWNMLELYMGFGASPYSSDLKKATLNSPEGVKALTFLISLIDSGLTTPGAPTLKDENMPALFNEGKIAVNFDAAASSIGETLSAIEKKDIKVPMEPVLVGIPYESGKKPVAFVGPDGITMFKNDNAATVKAAKDFLKFMAVDNPRIQQFVKKTGLIPGKNSPDLYKDASPILKFNLERAAAMIDKYGRTPFYSVPNLNNVRDVLFPEIQAAYAKAKTPQKALDDFVTAANAVIAKAS